MSSIIRVIVALITFSFGVSFVLIFTANRPSEQIHNVPVRVVPAVTINSHDPFVPTNIAQSTNELFLDYDPKEFHPRGDYFILGQKPKAFREFDFFELAVDETDGNASGNALFGTDSNGKKSSFYTVSGSVTKKQLIFFAIPLSEEDFEFRFKGHFLKDGWIYTAGKNQAVVKGKLAKLKNGVKIAECEVKFRVEYLGC